MKLFRISASALAFCAIALLAACGGGGGGGGVTPPGGSGGPPPTPTPVSSATPTPASSNPPVDASTTVAAERNYINGDMSWYTSGKTVSWTTSGGDTATGFGTVDSLTCNTTTEPIDAAKYSQHAFVGIIANGKELALPTGIGIKGAVEPAQPTYDIEKWNCEYNIHTHDYSGLVHVEDTTQAQSNATLSYANLQTLLDIWGVQLTGTALTAGANTLSGNVAIYVGTPSGKDSHGNDLVTSYTAASSAASVTLAPHQAIWIVVGDLPANGIPQVAFWIDN